MPLKDKTIAPGQIVQFYPSEKQRPRPAIIVEIYDIRLGIVSLHVFKDERMRDHKVSANQLYPYHRPRLAENPPMPDNTWCWPEEAIGCAEMTRPEREMLAATRARSEAMFHESDEKEKAEQARLEDPHMGDLVSKRDRAVARSRHQAEQDLQADPELAPEQVDAALARYREKARERPAPTVVEPERFDDLTALPGIGDARQAVLNRAGVKTFEHVAGMGVVDLVDLLAVTVTQGKEIVDEAGAHIEDRRTRVAS
jgi:predicted flap endonuclease-1-like 5' DNA nuclease